MKNAIVTLLALVATVSSYAKTLECYKAEDATDMILYTSGDMRNNNITGVTVFSGNQKLRFPKAKAGMVDRHTWVLEAQNKDNNTHILLEYKFSYSDEDGTLFIFHADNQVSIEKVSCELK